MSMDAEAWAWAALLGTIAGVVAGFAIWALSSGHRWARALVAATGALVVGAVVFGVVGSQGSGSGNGGGNNAGSTPSGSTTPSGATTPAAATTPSGTTTTPPKP